MYMFAMIATLRTSYFYWVAFLMSLFIVQHSISAFTNNSSIRKFWLFSPKQTAPKIHRDTNHTDYHECYDLPKAEETNACGVESFFQ